MINSSLLMLLVEGAELMLRPELVISTLEHVLASFVTLLKRITEMVERALTTPVSFCATRLSTALRLACDGDDGMLFRV